jgi:DNA-binding MarR family transcriptional regulator/N-acetylglutamate synthase-like GNAT family acetyltransferase
VRELVDRVRAFNRGWTEVLGLLDEGLLATEHTLAEARVIFELAQRPSWERLELRHRLGMDASFLTRVLTRLETDGLVESTPSPTDGRALDLALTGAGREAYAELDARSAAQIGELVSGLSEDQRRTLAESMAVITSLIRPGAGDRSVLVRGLQPGDMGWVVERHGAIYADELGWDGDFEALVARIVSDYHADLRPGLESAWIAEVDGARAGCIFCCQRDASTAQLRILLVEPWARGLGIGTRLVGECVSFAARAGYDAIVLWTNDVLVSARRIYEAAGFRLVDEDRHHSFGHDLVGQHWELALR